MGESVQCILQSKKEDILHYKTHKSDFLFSFPAKKNLLDESNLYFFLFFPFSRKRLFFGGNILKQMVIDLIFVVEKTK
jgi:hypothetical protein